MSSRRVLVIGLDGVSYNIVEEMVHKGKLHVFDKLFKNGASGKLESTIPSMTVPAWPVMFSGKGPAKLGAMYFTTLNRDYSTTPVNSLFFRGDMIWDIVGEKNIQVGVVNVPSVNPEYEVNGFMVTGWIGPNLRCYPQNLAAELSDQFSSVKDSALRALKEIDAAKDNFRREVKLFKKLLSKDWGLFIFCETYSDIVLHFGGRRDIEDAYEALDDFLFGLIKEVERSGWYLFVVSDHGCCRARRRFNLNSFLEYLGLLSLNQKWKMKFQTMFAEIAAQVFPLSFLATIRRIVKGILGVEDITMKYDLQHFNLRKTKAFALGGLCDSYGFVWINDNKRFSKGTIVQEECEVILNELSKRLRNLKDPKNNERVIDNIYLKNEVYPDGKNEYFPDLIIKAKDEYIVDSRFFGSIFILSENFKHHQEGLFAVYGPGVKKNIRLSKIKMIDVAPTILYVLGLPLPDGLDGRPLIELFYENSEIAKTKVRYEKRKSKLKGKWEWDKEAAEEVKKRLQKLGYL